MPGGFLLDVDARAARLSEFDDWVDEQKKKAADAASAAQQTVQAAVAPVVQAAQPVVQAAIPTIDTSGPSEALQRFDAWAAEQLSQQQAKAAQQAQPAPVVAPAPTPALSTAPSAVTDTTLSPVERFDQWVAEQQQKAATAAQPVTQTVGDTAQSLGTAAQSALPHAEEPATQTDTAPGPDLGKNWKTQFDFGAVYTGDYRTGTPHRGVDLVPSNGGGIGTEVDAFAPGTVTNVFRDPGGAGGLIVYVQDAQGLTHAYMHLANTAPGLAVGQQVSRGQPIAMMGESGTEGSPHLHYEVRKNASNGDPLNQLIDPRPYVSGDKQPGGTAVAPAATTGQTNSQQTGNLPSNTIDASSPTAFAKSMAPYAQYAAQKLGIDPTWVAAMAASESNYGKADAAGHELFGVKALPGQPGTTLMTHEGQNGGVNMNQDFAAYDSPLDAVNAWIDLIQNHYKGAVNAKDLPTFIHGLRQGGYFTAGEQEYLNIVQGIQNRIGGDVTDAIQSGAQAVGGAVGGAASAVGTAASNAGQTALNTATNLSGQVATRAQDLVNQGKTQLQQLQDQTAQLQQQLDDSRTKLQAAQDAAAKQNEQYRTGIQQQIDQTTTDLLKPRDFSGTLNAATQTGQDLLGGANKAVGSAFDQAQDLGSQAITGLGDLGQQAVSRAQGFTAPLTTGLQGTALAASREAEQQQANPSVTVQGSRLLAGLTGQTLTPQAEDVITRLTPPMLQGLSLDPGGVVSAGLKGAGANQTINDLLQATGTPRLTSPIGDTPLADIAGLGTNLAIPTGAESKAAATGARAVEAASAGSRLPEVVSRFLTGEGAQAGSVNPLAAIRLAGGAAGVAGSEATMPEDQRQNLLVRVSRDLTAGLLGAAAPTAVAGLGRGALQAARGEAPSLADLAALRQSMTPAATAAAGGPQTAGQVISALGKQNLMGGFGSQLMNVASQLVELGRIPARALAAGEGDQALLALRAGAYGVPEAMRQFAQTFSSGVAAGGGSKTGAWLPVFRFLGATDDAFRTLGAHMGQAVEAQRLVNEAGATTPADIQRVLQSNVRQIYDAGREGGATSVFQTLGAAGAHDTGNPVARWKESLLGSVAQSPGWQSALEAGGRQALGLVVDAVVPFSGMPQRLFDIGIGRLPVVGETRRFVELSQALKAGDAAGAQRAFGELGLQSVLSSTILSNVFAGNVRGPDDAEHPSSVLINGQWVDYSRWGAFQLPLAMPAAAVEAIRKENNKPDPQMTAYMAAVMNAWGKTLLNASYLNNAFDLATSIGQGSLSNVTGQLATSYADRFAPAALKEVEQTIDANVRDVSKQFPQSVVQRWMSRVPYLAQTLEPRLNLATGQALPSLGTGGLLGVQRPSDPVTAEIGRLNRQGYSALSLPSTMPTSVTSKGGGRLNLPEGSREQKAVAQKRSEILQEVLQDVISDPGWAKMSDDEKAQTLANVIGRVEARIQPMLFGVAMETIGDAETERRVAGNRTIAGKRVGTPGTPNTPQAMAPSWMDQLVASR